MSQALISVHEIYLIVSKKWNTLIIFHLIVFLFGDINLIPKVTQSTSWPMTSTEEVVPIVCVHCGRHLSSLVYCFYDGLWTNSLRIHFGFFWANSTDCLPFYFYHSYPQKWSYRFTFSIIIHKNGHTNGIYHFLLNYVICRTQITGGPFRV